MISKSSTSIIAAPKVRLKDCYKVNYFITLSADALPDQIDKARQAGFDRYLTKPIELPVIIDLFEEFAKTQKVY